MYILSVVCPRETTWHCFYPINLKSVQRVSQIRSFNLREMIIALVPQIPFGDTTVGIAKCWLLS